MPTESAGSERTLAAAALPESWVSIAPTKPATKPGSRGSTSNGTERPLRSNTQNNRNMNSGISRDEEFYEKVQ
jgi:hypothetical protein